MKMPESFFHIERRHLKDLKLFPFHIYIYNSGNNNYSPFLYANSPLTKEKDAFLSYVIKKGAEIAIGSHQEKTFLRSTHNERDDIPFLKGRDLDPLEVEREKRIQALIRKRENNPSAIYKLQDGLESCTKSNNFLPMILAAQEEIMTFSVNNSQTVSLASYLSENLMNDDNEINRIVAISYFLAKTCDIKDETALADTVCSSFFCHLGLTQMDFYLNHKPQIELNGEEKKKYKKHPGYSHHVLLKSKVDISDRCKSIIFQHHERANGSGYPSHKTEDHIDTIALIVGAVSHILEFSSGSVTGVPTPFRSVIKYLKNKTLTPGLEFEFGDKIFENLVYLINTDKAKDDEKLAA